MLRSAGFNLDQPMTFLHRCMRDEVEVERADFLREVMDVMASDETRYQWSLHVDQLIDGEMTWEEFSDLLADALDLKPNSQGNTIGSGMYIHDIIISLGDTHHDLIHRWRRALLPISQHRCADRGSSLPTQFAEQARHRCRFSPSKHQSILHSRRQRFSGVELGYQYGHTGYGD
jgi:hypothetical protein